MGIGATNESGTRIIAYSIIAFFIFLGSLLPFVADTVGGNATETAIDTDDIGFTDIVTSIAGMFFWTFGTLPFWLDLLFIPLRIYLALELWDLV